MDAGEQGTLEELKAATREWVEAAEEVRKWRERHFAFWWTESEEEPPEPEVVTREALAELERLQLKEREARDKWAKVNRALLGRS